MPTIQYFLACATPSIGLDGRTLSVLMVVESIVAVPHNVGPETLEHLRQCPYVLPSMGTVAQWWNPDDGEDKRVYEQRVLIVAPDEKETQVVPPVEFRFGGFHHHVVYQTPPVGLRILGKYRWRLQYREQNAADWIVAGEYWFLVHKAEDWMGDNKSLAQTATPA
jgi:hypothetical protein